MTFIIRYSKFTSLLLCKGHIFINFKCEIILVIYSHFRKQLVQSNNDFISKRKTYLTDGAIVNPFLIDENLTRDRFRHSKKNKVLGKCLYI